jgi:hypothetical protein
MTAHLGHDRHERRQDNSRNGHTTRTVATADGAGGAARAPRPRRNFRAHDHARYQTHLRELYGTDMPHELISEATESVQDLFRDGKAAL